MKEYFATIYNLKGRLLKVDKWACLGCLKKSNTSKSRAILVRDSNGNVIWENDNYKRYNKTWK